LAVTPGLFVAVAAVPGAAFVMRPGTTRVGTLLVGVVSA
jgi:hypothetical protein